VEDGIEIRKKKIVSKVSQIMEGALPRREAESTCVVSAASAVRDPPGPPAVVVLENTGFGVQK
jgi:hypothetical protein